MRAPSVRDPRSFFDVFVLTAIAVLAMAVVLQVANTHVVRVETVAFVALVFLWDGWAIMRILERTA